VLLSRVLAPKAKAIRAAPASQAENANEQQEFAEAA
jgi:hypothetical protein